MAAIDYDTARREIDAEVKSLSGLPANLAGWFEKHQAPLKKEVLSVDPEGKKQEEFWLITQSSGSYRIAYDDAKKMFGLECGLQSGVPWFMGYYGSLKETIEHL